MFGRQPMKPGGDAGGAFAWLASGICEAALRRLLGSVFPDCFSGFLSLLWLFFRFCGLLCVVWTLTGFIDLARFCGQCGIGDFFVWSGLYRASIGLYEIFAAS